MYNPEQLKKQKDIEKHNREKANAYQPNNGTVCGRKSYDPTSCQVCEYVSICKE